MDTTLIIGYAKEFAFVLIIFVTAFSWTIFIGRQSVINITCGIYLALAMFPIFPYTNIFTGMVDSSTGKSIIEVAIFTLFSVAGFYAFSRLMPREYLEGKFESFPKKVMLSVGLTFLILLVCFTTIPVSSLISPQPELLRFFTNEELEFWWLTVPLIVTLIN